MANRNNYEDLYQDPYDVTEELKRQVNEELNEEMRVERQMTNNSSGNQRKKKRKRKKKLWKGILIFVLLLVILTGLLVGTQQGRKIIYNLASMYITSKTSHEEEKRQDELNYDTSYEEVFNSHNVVGRKESYVTNILLIGIEEINGARNTDSMIIASVNTKDDTIKLTSLMRDSYVNVPGWKKTKLNAAYAHGGIALLKQTIEENYKIHIDGYASVNFESFEELIDSLGGINVQLGEKEAAYLNKTNYISKKKNRNVKPGMNVMNGNQALGYCRVRKVPTYDGVNNDYGRTLRQRRVLNAIFEKYKSKNIFSMMSIANDSIKYVSTSLNQSQMSKLMEDVIENNTQEMETMQMPVEGHYQSPAKYEGVTWPIVLEWDANIMELYKFIYGDTEEEARTNLALYSK